MTDLLMGAVALCGVMGLVIVPVIIVWLLRGAK